eukprot:30627_1
MYTIKCAYETHGSSGSYSRVSSDMFNVLSDLVRLSSDTSFTMARYSYYDYLDNYYDGYYEGYWSRYFDVLYNNSNSTFNGTFPPSPYKQPSYADFICPFIFYLSVLFTLLSIGILSFASYKLCVLHKRNKVTAQRVAIAITMTCLTIHMITNIFNMLTLYTWYMDWRIQYQLHSTSFLWDIFWCLSKVSLYIVFMQRYYTIFTAVSAFSTRKTQLRKYFVFVIACVVQATLVFMYILIYFGKIIIGKSHAHTRRVYLNLFWAFLVGDLILISLLAYLLTRSILNLIVSVDARRSEFEIELPVSQGLSHQDTEDTRTKDVSTVDQTNDTENDEPNVERIPSITKRVLRERSKKQKQLIFTTTRLALLYVISLTSSVVYQCIWALAAELMHDGLRLVGYTWYVDATINMICIYLAMWIAHPEYKLICQDLCKCHQCMLWCIHRAIEYKADQQRREFKTFETVEIEGDESEGEEEAGITHL